MYVGWNKRNGISLIAIALAKIPQANLVKVVQPQAARYRVEQLRILDRQRDDVGDVELEEVDVGQDGPVVRVADKDEDEHDNSDGMAGRGGDCRVPALGAADGRSSTEFWGHDEAGGRSLDERCERFWR